MTTEQQASYDMLNNIISNPKDAKFVVVDGILDVIAGGKKINELQKGDYFGEMAIIDSQARSASVQAISDVVLLRIDKNDFYDILSQREEVAIGIIKVLSQRLRDLNKKLVEKS